VAWGVGRSDARELAWGKGMSTMIRRNTKGRIHMDPALKCVRPYGAGGGRRGGSVGADELATLEDMAQGAFVTSGDRLAW
jgi:hypothetical protein